MSAGTKVSVAIVVLFAAVLGIYYGFGGPDGAGPLPGELLPPAEEDPIVGTANDTSGGDLAGTIEEGVARAAQAIDDRSARELLEEFRRG